MRFRKVLPVICVLVHMKYVQTIHSVFDTSSPFLEAATELLKISDGVSNESKNGYKLEKTLDDLSINLMELNEKLERIEGDMNQIKTQLNDLPSLFHDTFLWHEKWKTENFIDHYYNSMKLYSMNLLEYEPSTLSDFAETVTSRKVNSISSLLYSFSLAIQNVNISKHNKTVCDQPMSSQQIYLQIQNQVAHIYLKGHMTVQYGFMIRKLFEKGMFRKEMKDANDEYRAYLYNLTHNMKHFVIGAPLELWRCNPEKHVEDETYVQIANFLHGLIINEINLNPHGNCRQECNSFDQQHYLQVFNKKLQIPCPRIMNCRNIDGPMSVCLQQIQKNNRRYKYVKFDNGKTLGKEQPCERNDITRLEYWREFIFFKCSYCWCLCDEGTKPFSHRYINLRLAQSNIKKNMVVTGIRFVKHNKIIHLQVQEGKLLKYGEIDENSVHWVPVENYSTTDPFIVDNSGYHTIDEGQDYHVLSWKERSIDLDDIMVQDENSVVTGVRFRKFHGRLHLQLHATKFNFTTGRLWKRSSYFIDNPYINFRQKFGIELKLVSPDVPTVVTPRKTDITSAKYVKFTQTDYIKDAGQTTVPFFDAQPVESAIPAPLSGIGLFHKGQEGSGGFVAPRIFTYDFGRKLGDLQEKISNNKLMT